MTFVALSIPDWPTGAAANDLLAQLLAVAPRAAVTPAEHIAWLDARSLDPLALAARARDALRAIGVACSAGVSRIPMTAILAARRQDDLRIADGEERRFLAPLPLEVLTGDGHLLALCRGIGLSCCAELARLDRDAVAVRLGREGVSLWQLARADDARRIFSARPRELPNASLDWTEFSTTNLEQLVFVLHSLLKTVCDALLIDGLGATSLTLTLSLENRTTLVQQVGAARATAQRTTWLRLVRRALERMTLPDRVTGVAVQVDIAAPPTIQQGDLFDLGFASAHAAESAVGHVLDLQGDAVVTPVHSSHPLPERRVRWVTEQEARGTASRIAASAPVLHPMLLPVPREVAVLATTRRGFAIPVRYTDNSVAHPLQESLGPHCISGDRWTERVAREYHQGVRADGTVVLLYRDVANDQWYLAGWWD